MIARHAEAWVAQGLQRSAAHPRLDADLRHPRSGRIEIRADQINCMGLVSAPAQFSNWAQNEDGPRRGKKADPRSFCIQKTLQVISHSEDVEFQLMFAGHNAYRFGSDPFYSKWLRPDGEGTRRTARKPAD